MLRIAFLAILLRKLRKGVWKEFMKENSLLSLLKSQIIERPLALALFILFTQAFLSLSLISLSLPEEKTHGAQAFLSPVDALAMQGQRVYYQEGCHYCHTQHLGPFVWELKRFTDLEKLGHFPAPDIMEYYFETPFPKGSRRIGPDLSRTASLHTRESLETLLKNKGGQKTENLKELTHPYAYLFEENEGDKKAGSFASFSSAWKIRFMLQMKLPFSEAYQRSFLSNENVSRGELLTSYLLSRGKKHIQFKGKYYQKN